MNARQDWSREAPTKAQYGSVVSWWDYVSRVTGGEEGVRIAAKMGVDQSTVSRWKTTNAPGKAENVAKLARAYDRPVLEAFVAADFLTEAEAKVRPAAAPDLTQLRNDELLKLVRARMREEGELGGDTAANTTPDAPRDGASGRTKKRTYPQPVKRAARGERAKD